MPARSCLSLASAFSIRSSVSNRISSTLITLVPFTPSACLSRRRALLGHHNLAADKRADASPVDGALDVAFLLEVEYQDRHVVLHALRDRSGVHDAQILLADRIVAQLAVQQSMGILLGVVAIDAVNAGGLEQDVGLELEG